MKNLGPAVTAVHNAILADVDYKRNLYINLEAARSIDQVAHSFGFRDLTHLRNELERRTSGRVAYSFIPPFIVE